VSATDAPRKEELAAQGYVPAGKPTLQGGKRELLGTDGVSELTKPSQNEAQKGIMDAQSSLDMLGQTMAKYDPSFSTLPTQLLSKGMGWFERAGGKLSPDQKAQHGAYTAWQRNTVDGLNRYIKAITGAQMAVAEADRIMKAYPKPQDGPTEYINNVREVTKQLLQVQKRNRAALAQGLKLYGDDWEGMPLPAVSDKEVDAYMQLVWGIGAPAQPGFKFVGEAK